MENRFKPVFRVDGRWTVRDLDNDMSALPTTFELNGLTFEDAAILACFFNNLLERDVDPAAPKRIQ